MWDPRLYLDFDGERTQPCIDLAQRIAIDPEHAVDLGCGPGNSANVIRSRWPEARITGVDSSARTLAMARETNPDAEWIQADIATWRPAEPVDLIFSNAALQWAPDHLRLLPDLVGHIRSGGVFAMQIPSHLSSPAHTLIEDLCRRSPWSEWLDPPPRPYEILTLDDYYRMLSPLARSLELWATSYWHVLENPEAIVHWMRATGLRPYIGALPDDRHPGFLAAYTEEIERAFPAQPDGRALFPFHRLFVVANV